MAPGYAPECLLSVTVPVNTVCEAVLPDGTTHPLGSGEYRFSVGDEAGEEIKPAEAKRHSGDCVFRKPGV